MDPTETTVLGDNLDLTSEPQTPDLTPIPYALGIEEQTPEEAEDMSKFTEETTPTLTHEKQEQLNNRLFDAITRYDTSKEDIEDLITAGADVNAVAGNGNTALILAVTAGHTEGVDALIAAGAGVDATDRYGSTPLMWAAVSGRTEIIEALKKAGAEVDATRDGKTALFNAARNGHTESIKTLIKAGAKVDPADKSGRTALMEAAFHRHTESIKTLIKAGADVDAVRNIDLDQPSRTISRDEPHVIKELFAAHDQRLNQVADFLIDRKHTDGQGRVRVNVKNLNDDQKALLEDAKRFNANNIKDALQTKGIDEEQARLMMENVKTHDPLNHKHIIDFKNQTTRKKAYLPNDVTSVIFSHLLEVDKKAAIDAGLASIIVKTSGAEESRGEVETHAPAAVAVAGGGKDPNSLPLPPEVKADARKIGKGLSDAVPGPANLDPDYSKETAASPPSSAVAVGSPAPTPENKTPLSQNELMREARLHKFDNAPFPPKGGHGI